MDWRSNFYGYLMPTTGGLKVARQPGVTARNRNRARESLRSAETPSSMGHERSVPTSPEPPRLATILSLTFRNLARLLCRLVLYASIYMLLRLAIRLAVLRTQIRRRARPQVLALRHQVAALRRQVKRL